MATLEDVRRIALDLPGTSETVEGHRGGASWRTPNGSFVWERGPSVTDLRDLAQAAHEWPSGEVAGLRTDGLEAKEELMAAYPAEFFSIPHFDGYPAVLVRLESIDLGLLREVITDAWLLRAPKRVAKAWLEENGSASKPV
jgi:hypothetical protein